MEASNRRAVREAERLRRAGEKQQRADGKEDAIRQAHSEVEVHNALLVTVASVHRECGVEWDWAARRDALPPTPAQLGYGHQHTACNALRRYLPTLMDRLSARDRVRRKELRAAVGLAQSRDREDHAAGVRAYEAAFASWANAAEFAGRILSGDPEAYSVAVRDAGAFSGVPITRTSLVVWAPKANSVCVDFDADADAVVPTTVKRVLATGVVSVKEMPLKDYHALYRDYVCGCVLRVAREVLAILPVEGAIVTAHRKRPNPRTGHVEQQPIASAAVPRASLPQIRWDSVQPTMAMTNFLHRVQFDEKVGVLPVSPIGNSDAR